MDPERARIQADLSGIIDGQIRCDASFLQMYASDASIYEIKPLGVIRPTGLSDVVACVKYAKENGIPLIARGAGSNVAGCCVGTGLILDFSYSMRRVDAVGRDDVTVQPGVVLGNLNLQLLPHGRIIGPDPATRNVTTIGGMLSTNSSGSHWIRYGSPGDNVKRLQVVMASGDVVEIDAPTEGKSFSAPSGQAKLLDRDVGNVIRQNRDLINQHRPNVKQNQAGYNVFDYAPESGVDLAKLIVGSEGTLGLITEATLKTHPLPRHRGVALLFFHRLDDAAQAAMEMSNLKVVACDLLDRRLLSLAREKDEQFKRNIPQEAEAMLLVEFQANDNQLLQSYLDQLITKIVRKKKLAFDYRITSQQSQRDIYWRIVRRTVPTLFKLRGDRRAVPFVEDITIPPEKLPDFLRDVHRILNAHEATASIFAHVPQGHVHLRPFMSLSHEADLQVMQKLANELFEQTLQYNGTISGCHGSGLSRTWFLRRQFGPSYNVFSKIKNIFDPENILNPGKIVGHPHSGLTDHIRAVEVSPDLLLSTQDETENETSAEFESSSLIVESTPQGNGTGAANGKISPSTPLPVIEPLLNWDASQIARTARDCNGCGRCRTQASLERMCPMFRLSPQEEASPRAKANLMRGIFTGQLDSKLLTQDEFKSVVDLCVNCHQCRLDCPASVDIPKLMVEAKAQYFATNGLKISDWLLARLDWLYGVAERVPRLTNFLMQSRWSRWVLDRLLGIAQGRKLPLVANQPFSRWSQRERLHRPSSQQGRKVVYFVDAYANWNDVELGKAFSKILKHNGIDVVVPAGQSISGMSLISEGSLARAKRLAARNVELLAEWVRQGYEIVATEPSAVLALRHEYLNLLDDPDASLVSDHCIDAMSFLLRLHRQGNLELDFRPVNASVGYHLPCHQRVLADNIPAVEVLRLIPGIQVEFFNKGCSGMAGTYGIKRKNYVRSLRMGFGLINSMRSPDIIAGTTECSACKIQMEQGTTKPTIHPIKILAMAYGLMPELDDLFNRSSRELVVT